MDIINQTVQKIKNLEIQGATAIVNESLKALSIWVHENPHTAFPDFKSQAGLLKNARPTEPYIQNVIKMLLLVIEKEGMDKAEKVIGEMEANLRKNREALVACGTEILRGKNVFLTHCHAGTANDILIKIHRESGAIKVYSTETRPLYQGRITAKNLSEAGIEVISIIDSHAAGVLYDSENTPIDALLLGADVLLNDGSVINKVGSHGVALAAYTYGIPVYVCASLFKFSSKDLPIELRDGNEVWPDHPENIKIENPAFDKVSAEYITGIITEAGVIEPGKLAEKVKEYYPEIIKP